jgi:prepilin-type N-terminal cleavage/methylation domain-containing protein
MRKRFYRHGFTLVELIIVIVIVGILVSIAVPLYLHYSETAKIREGLGMIKAIMTSQKLEGRKASKYYTATGGEASAIFLEKGIDVRDSIKFTYETVGQIDGFTVTATATPESGLTGAISYNSATRTWSCTGGIIENMLPKEPEWNGAPPLMVNPDTSKDEEARGQVDDHRRIKLRESADPLNLEVRGERKKVEGSRAWCWPKS